jgi:DNA-binding transcriptional MerR regulator
MTSRDVPIGIASEQSGVKVPTIRYYEDVGLLPKASRTKSNRRHYGTADVHRLIFIRRARELGFDLIAIRDLLALQENPEQTCVAACEIARARLGEIERRIEVLVMLKGELESIVHGCSRGRVAECRVMEVLATPPAVR